MSPSVLSKVKSWHVREEEEEGDPCAFQFFLHHMKSFVINKSAVYALYMAVSASKHIHTQAGTHRNPLKHSHISQEHDQMKSVGAYCI